MGELLSQHRQKTMGHVLFHWAIWLVKDVAGNETQEKSTLRFHVHIRRMDNHKCRLFYSLAEVDVGRGGFFYF